MANTKTGSRAGTFSVDVASAMALFQSNDSVKKRGVQTGITTPGDGMRARYIRIDNNSTSGDEVLVGIPDQWGSSTVPIPAGGFKEFFNVDYLTVQPETAVACTGTYYVGLDM